MEIPKQAQELAVQLRSMQEKLEKQIGSIVAEASAGEGLVTARMNGKKQLIDLRIAPEAFEHSQVALQDLLLAAINEASRLVDEQLTRLG
jgi:DNA-binding YbaB/EbfC family protein